MYKLTQVVVLLGIFSFSACGQKRNQPKNNVYSVIPAPAEMEKKKGFFMLDSDTKILLLTADEETKTHAKNLARVLQQKFGYSQAVETGFDLNTENVPSNSIAFLQVKSSSTSPERYHLSISPKNIIIASSTPAGTFYGIQTFWQLFQGETSCLAAVEIEDSPRYVYRGMHLDVARHFFPASFVKKYIDYLARYKFNRFHWHLTEDQGWRIEIKKYPKLQEVAAYRKETLIGHYRDKPHRFDGQRYGGYYTQEEIKDIVAYAGRRNITVIPEIEMPGHSKAALAAYPELACSEGPFEVATKWGIFEDVYCPTEETFAFLEDILTEVMALFPSPYIHIGGDECPKKAWKNSTFCQNLIKEKDLGDENGLQRYFIQRIEQFLNKNGRSIIGWDEILEGGLPPNATVMSWRGTKGGIEAAEQGHDVIMTPSSHCYFDHYQSESPDEPLAIGGFTSLEKVYSFEPTPEELSPEKARHILGAQGNVWTEYIETPEQVEYMILPRMCALAEVLWSPKDDRDYQDFIQRLEPQMIKLKKEGINVANYLLE